MMSKKESRRFSKSVRQNGCIARSSRQIVAAVEFSFLLLSHSELLIGMLIF